MVFMFSVTVRPLLLLILLLLLFILLLLLLVMLLLLLLMSLLWPCLLLLITSYLIVVTRCYSEAPKGYNLVSGVGWGGGWVVCKVIFVSNPTKVLWLCCVVVGVVTKNLKIIWL